MPGVERRILKTHESSEELVLNDDEASAKDLLLRSADRKSKVRVEDAGADKGTRNKRIMLMTDDDQERRGGELTSIDASKGGASSKRQLNNNKSAIAIYT